MLIRTYENVFYRKRYRNNSKLVCGDGCCSEKKRIAKNVTREPEIHMIISPRRRKYLRNEWENEYRYLKKI